MALQITRVNTPGNMIQFKCPYAMNAKTLTFHETGNFATAMAEISYMLSNTNEVSYHFAVDEERAVQGVPLDRNTWNSGDGQGQGNRGSIAIEICYNYRNGQLTNGDSTFNSKYLKARANAIELAANLCVERGIVPKQGVTLFRHYDRNGKNCPQRIISDGYWRSFCNEIVKKYNQLKGGSTSMYHKKGSCYYDILENQTSIYYEANFKKKYHGWYSKESRVWISSVKQVSKGVYMGKSPGGWISLNKNYVKPV